MKTLRNVALLLCFLLLAGCATNQGRIAAEGEPLTEALAKKKKPKPPKHKPGVFDYYVLALSWSRTHCDSRPDDASPQCAPDARRGFVVHGLWPQYERGYPENCRSVAPLSDELIAEQMDIMPSEKLIEHEWSKHGTCSGLPVELYFATLRNAFDSLALPTGLQLPTDAQITSVRDLERSLLDANDGAYRRGADDRHADFRQQSPPLKVAAGRVHNRVLTNYSIR